jgi:hypothetical protein
MKMLEPASNPFLVIRATVEAQIPAPGILAVSSTLNGDGGTSMSAGIARSLAGSGYRALAVETGANVQQAVSVDGAASRLVECARPMDAGCDFISIACAQARSASSTAITALYQKIREHYEYAVVDAGLISGGGLPFSRNADGVVLALREGRPVADADRETVEVFERLRVHFLGVIATQLKKGAEKRSLYEWLQPVPRRVAPEKPEAHAAHGIAIRSLEPQRSSNLVRALARSDR